MENIGALAILLAFCFAVYAVIASLVGKLAKRPFLVISAERAVYSIWVLLSVAAGLLMFSPGCRRTEEVKVLTVTTGAALPREEIPVPSVHFTDITGPAGIDFRHFTGAFGNYQIKEIGPGFARGLNRFSRM